MTRKETELQILEKLKEIRELALAYSPGDDYLSMYFLKGHVSLCNGVHPVKKLDCWEQLDDGKGPYHPGLEEDEETPSVIWADSSLEEGAKEGDDA